MRTDATHEPELFWALRGGGGNFGVVTALEFAVVPVRELYAGALFFGFERTTEVLHTWTALLDGLPDEITSWANIIHFPPLPEVPEPVRGRSFAIVNAAFLGTEEAGRSCWRRCARSARSWTRSRCSRRPRSATWRWIRRDPLPFRSAHALVDDLPAAAIEEIARIAVPGSPIALVQLRHMGGALARHDPRGGRARDAPRPDLHAHDLDRPARRRRWTRWRRRSAATASTRTSSRSRRTRRLLRRRDLGAAAPREGALRPAETSSRPTTPSRA